MKKMNALVMVLLATTLVLASCQSSSKEVIATTLTPEITEALNVAILDEYKAEITYQKVLNDFGPSTRPFSTIINAEKKHAAALANLLTNYQLPVPENPYQVAQMSAYSSAQSACEAGAEAEIENINMYDQLLTLDIPSDIRKVFENNRNASFNNHLPAFNACK